MALNKKILSGGETLLPLTSCYLACINFIESSFIIYSAEYTGSVRNL